MTKVLVIFYSAWGHVEVMAEALAAGARDAGAEVDIRRIPETAPKKLVEQSHYKVDSPHPIIENPEVLATYDAIAFGSPTRFGRMSGQLATFLDSCGGLWRNGSLVGKVGAAFTSSATQHGGQETTQFSMLTNLLHFGMTIIGLDYNFKGQNGVETVHGNSPYGASTIAANDGSRRPSEIDLAGAKHLGIRLAQTATKLRA